MTLWTTWIFERRKARFGIALICLVIWIHMKPFDNCTSFRRMLTWITQRKHWRQTLKRRSFWSWISISWEISRATGLKFKNKYLIFNHNKIVGLSKEHCQWYLALQRESVRKSRRQLLKLKVEEHQGSKFSQFIIKIVSGMTNTIYQVSITISLPIDYHYRKMRK